MLIEDGAQYAQTVAEGVEVAHTVDPPVLEAGDFGDNQPCGCDAEVDQGFYLEAVTPQPTATVSW